MPENDSEFSLKSLIVPLYTYKAVTIIIVVGIITFFNCLFNPFVIDDRFYLIQNQSIHDTYIYDMFFSKDIKFNQAGRYMPIYDIYLSFLYAFFPSSPVVFHVLQVALHITNAVLLFRYIKRFFNSGVSLLSSLVFLVHPLQVESVAYIAATNNPLFFLFGIIALTLGLQERIGVRRMISISCLLLLSLLSKETGILFIVLMLLQRTIFYKRQMFPFIIGAGLAVFTYALARFVITGSYFTLPSMGPGRIYNVSFDTRLMNIPAVIFYYIKNLFYPSHLGVEQYWVIGTVDFSHFYLPLIIDSLFLAVLLLIGWWILKAHRNLFPTFLFFVSWFILGIVFHSQIFPLDVTVADRFMYLPVVGLLGVIGVCICAFKLTSNSRLALGVSCAVIVISLLSIRTMYRNANWSDEFTLFTHDLDTEKYGITTQEEWFVQIR